MEKLKFGIIGCGSIAARFAKALEKSEGAELIACAARQEERAAAFAAEHGVPRHYGSYEALLADEEVQAVYIATVHTAHAQAAKACILAGKAVLCEKPFFTNSKEAREVIDLAREKQVLVMEAFWTRTVPAYAKVKEWIADGKIGDVSLIQAAFGFCVPYVEETKNHRLFNPEVGGGAMLDAGVYPYEYAAGIIGEHPEKVTAVVQRHETGVDASVVMTLEFPCGAIADCMTSIAGFNHDDALISGSRGFIRQCHFIGSRRAELYSNFGGLQEVFEDPEEEGFVHEISHFVACYRAGKTESELIPLDDSLDFACRAEEILGTGENAEAPHQLPSRFSPEELAAQEERLRFESFSPEDALRLAELLRQLSEGDGKALSVQIDLNGFTVYRAFPAGTGRLNDRWMEKKLSTVALTGKSTMRFWTELAAFGYSRPMEMLPTSELVTCGGGFPILLKDGSVIGGIAVSGPGDAYEHEVIVRAMERFIEAQ